MSRRLLALEDELGVALFERTTRGMVPTTEGQVFVRHARAILGAVEAARRAVGTGPTEGCSG